MTMTEIVTEPRRTRWRWIQLASGVALRIVTFMTFGAGVMLARVGLVLTGVAAAHGLTERLRVLVRDRSRRPVGVLFLIALGILLHDGLVAR